MFREKNKTSGERTLWAEYREGFEVQLRYVPREHLRRIMERCKIQEWDKRTHQSTERSDPKKWAQEFAREVMVDWKGLTPAVLRVMVELAEYPEGPAPFSVEDAAYLLFHAYDFDLWAQQVSADLGAFVAAEEAEQTKKSAPSPAAS
jgi:hypothetical protein